MQISTNAEGRGEGSSCWGDGSFGQAGRALCTLELLEQHKTCISNKHRPSAAAYAAFFLLLFWDLSGVHRLAKVATNLPAAHWEHLQQCSCWSCSQAGTGASWEDLGGFFSTNRWKQISSCWNRWGTNFGAVSSVCPHRNGAQTQTWVFGSLLLMLLRWQERDFVCEWNCSGKPHTWKKKKNKTE